MGNSPAKYKYILIDYYNVCHATYIGYNEDIKELRKDLSISFLRNAFYSNNFEDLLLRFYCYNTIFGGTKVYWITIKRNFINKELKYALDFIRPNNLLIFANKWCEYDRNISFEDILIYYNIGHLHKIGINMQYYVQKLTFSQCVFLIYKLYETYNSRTSIDAIQKFLTSSFGPFGDISTLTFKKYARVFTIYFGRFFRSKNHKVQKILQKIPCELFLDKR